jgi:tetratricopeptide (TPR) repeat protein
MKGSFAEGLRLVPVIEKNLEEYALYVDPHRILVFNYKIAMLYFGAGRYEKAIDYLQRIINGPLDLRIDLQCYARLLHMMAHYELGNYDIMDSLIKSVYRFMARMKNLTVVEEEMFAFLKSSFTVSPEKIKPTLKKFLQKIKHLEKNPFETRSFAYLDTISWVESKVFGKPMGEIIFEKYKSHKKRRYITY